MDRTAKFLSALFSLVFVTSIGGCIASAHNTALSWILSLVGVAAGVVIMEIIIFSGIADAMTREREEL